MEPLLILVPAGTFVMGSDAGQEDEAPPHTVELAPFYLGRCAVTNREYALFLRESLHCRSCLLERPSLQSPGSARRGG